jgi:hypothetical protein
VRASGIVNLKLFLFTPTALCANRGGFVFVGAGGILLLWHNWIKCIQLNVIADIRFTHNGIHYHLFDLLKVDFHEIL